MDTPETKERIWVVASFGSGLETCVPRKFKRANGRVIEVLELGLRHHRRIGDKTWHIFDLTDGQSEYRLELDSERLTWWLTREAMYGD